MIRRICLLLFFIFAVFLSSRAFSGSPLVHVMPVEGQIEPGWLVFLERAVGEAEAAGAEAVILELNTPGGFIDTALSAKTLMDETPLPVYAYVKQQALSAGAYLALSAEGFYMAPGSTIGAAEPRILGGGEVIDEKLLSAWEGEMKSVAERQGRDPRLAAAMVRRGIEIESLVSAEELLTLTAGQAEELGFSDGTVTSRQDLLEALGLEGAAVVENNPSGWEQLSGWLIRPTVASAVLSLAFLFLIIEVLTAGFGIAGLGSILCFGLYFGGHFFAGVAGWPSIFLFLFGIILLLTEAFMPGFGIFGIGGLIAVAVSIVLTAASAAQGLQMLLVSFLVSGGMGFVAYKVFQRRGTLRRFILFDAATRELGYSSSSNYQKLVGQQGQTITPLRPSGTVEIQGTRYDVVSQGEYIEAKAPVVVVGVEGYRIIVRKVGDPSP